MPRLLPLLLLPFLALVSQPAAAQVAFSPVPLPAARASGGGASVAGNAIALDIGIVAGGLSYARRLGNSRWSAGGGVWGAWEPPNSFDRNVWEPIGVFLFGRYWPAAWLHGDVGFAAARYVWADDCSDCSGTFVGVRSLVLAGYRFVFVGPELAAGSVSDDGHGSDFGFLWGAQVRFILGFGR